MLIVTAALLASIFVGFNTKFQEAFKAAKVHWQLLAMEMPSTTSLETYAWLDQIPKMREWLGERVYNNLSTRAYQIVNKTYEGTIVVKREKIEDEQLGIFSPAVAMLGRRAAELPDDLVIDALKAGHQKECHDGQYFFDTDHPIDLDDSTKGVQSNLFASKPLTADNYAEVRAAMRALKDRNGESLGVEPNLLIVPPQLEAIARRIVQAELLPNTAGTASQSNVMKGTAEVLVLNKLSSDPTSWYLADTTQPIKPFIFQNRRPAEFAQQTAPDSDAVFKRGEYVFGVDARCAAGYGLWFFAAKATA